MNQDNFIKNIIERLVFSSLKEYIESFEENGRDVDDEWSSAIELYNGLKDDEKVVFKKIIEQIHVDVVADFLSFLDGEYWLKDQSEDVSLIYLDEKKSVLSGDLTTIFLNTIENFKIQSG